MVHGKLGFDLYFACCFLPLMCYNGVTAQGFTLTAVHSNGDPVNNGNVLENTEVKLRCTFGHDIIYTNLLVFNNTKNNWAQQIYCSDTDIIDTHAKQDAVELPVQQAVCTTAIFQVDYTAIHTSPTHFQCTIFYPGTTGEHQNYTLRTHTLPSRAIIEQSPVSTPTEGTQVNYTCQSTARPPPKLRFEYNGKIVRDGLYQDPEPSLIDVDSPSATSTIIWSTRTSSELNGISLSCVVYDHPAYARETIGTYAFVSTSEKDQKKVPLKPYAQGLIVTGIVVLLVVIAGVTYWISVRSRRRRRRHRKNPKKRKELPSSNAL